MIHRNYVNRKGYTLAEILTASAVAVLILGSIVGAYLVARTAINYSLAKYELDRDVDNVLVRIVKGAKEGASAWGLRSASGITLPAVTELRYTGTDGRIRRYYLNGNSIVYDSPTQWPNLKTIYAAPAGTAVTLRFWEPAGYSDHETIGIYIALLRQVVGVTASSSITTYVNIRNLPK